MTLRVTDHALVRFLERVGGLDVEGVRRQLAASMERAAVAARELGVDAYTVRADGITYVVENGHLITVLPPRAGVHRR